MTITTRPTVFISYASADLALAEVVHRRLTDAGFKVWFDKARLRPGCDWHKEIEAGCEASRVVLPVLTPRWKLSEWTKFETYVAEAVIPLIFEGAFGEIFTPPLARFQGQAIDLARGDEVAWDRLIEAVHESLARPVPDKLVRLAEVRFRANPYFVGREADLNRIHESLHENPTAVLTQGRVRAITALGGIGKTTLARQYIEKFWRCYPQIFWADCRLGVETEFARLCELLFPETRDETNVVQKAQLALRELQTRTDRLLILDNAEDEASIQAWIPKTGHCRTLITSRFAGWSAAVKSFHLYVLEPEPARTLLTTRAGRGDFAQLIPAEQTTCEALAKELGYLPLALEQAAAYIGQQGPQFSFADYLRLYHEATADLLAAGVLGSTEYPDSVMTTWATTLRKLDPPPKAILRLCAFLAPTPLPLTVLTGGSLVLLAEWAAVVGSPISPPTRIETWVRQHVAQLRDYSMVEGDGQSITLHTLVQTVQRLNLATTPDEHRTTLKRSLHWIAAAFVGDSGDVRTWPILNPLVPHATAIVHHADHAAIADPTTGLMNQLATLLFTKAQYAEAEPLMRSSLGLEEQSYGAEHPNLATQLNNLAQLLQDTNRLTEAEPLMRRALAIVEKAEESEHPHNAECLNNLAMLLKATNRLTEAEPLLRRALAIIEQFYGTEHPNVAVYINNLAELLRTTNRLAEAEPLYRRALAINEKFFPAYHPNVGLSLSSVAQLLRATNRLSEAEPLMRRSLAIYEQSYGTEHPKVAISLNNLAQLLKVTNRLAEAEPLMRRALAIDEQSYGTEHPDFAIHLDNLAQLLQATNRLAEAEPLTRRALAIFEQSYGAEHPNVATALNDLAQLLKATNRLGEAEPLMRRALAIDEQSHGAKHPVVARDLNNLAGLLYSTDRLAEAEPLICRAVTIFVDFMRRTGHEHPTLQTAFGNYAAILQAMGRSQADVDAALRDLMAE